MSWNVSIGPLPAKYIPTAIDQTELPEYAANDAQTSEEAARQLALGKRLAKTMLKSGCCGDTSDADNRFTVSIAGHANPGFKPRDGWAGDSVTVNVYQVVGHYAKRP